MAPWIYAPSCLVWTKVAASETSRGVPFVKFMTTLPEKSEMARRTSRTASLEMRHMSVRELEVIQVVGDSESIAPCSTKRSALLTAIPYKCAVSRFE